MLSHTGSLAHLFPGFRQEEGTVWHQEQEQTHTIKSILRFQGQSEIVLVKMELGHLPLGTCVMARFEKISLISLQDCETSFA